MSGQKSLPPRYMRPYLQTAQPAPAGTLAQPSTAAIASKKRKAKVLDEALDFPSTYASWQLLTEDSSAALAQFPPRESVNTIRHQKLACLNVFSHPESGAPMVSSSEPGVSCITSGIPVPRVKLPPNIMTWTLPRGMTILRTLYVTPEQQSYGVDLRLSLTDLTITSPLSSTVTLVLRPLVNRKISMRIFQMDILKLINIAFDASGGKPKDRVRLMRIAIEILTKRCSERLNADDAGAKMLWLDEKSINLRVGSGMNFPSGVGLDVASLDDLFVEVYEIFRNLDCNGASSASVQSGPSSGASLGGDPIVVGRLQEKSGLFGQHMALEGSKDLVSSVPALLPPIYSPEQSTVSSSELVEVAAEAFSTSQLPTPSDQVPSVHAWNSSADANHEREEGLQLTVVPPEKTIAHFDEQCRIIDSLQEELSRLKDETTSSSTNLITLQEENKRLKKENERLHTLASDDSTERLILDVMACAKLERQQLSRVRQETDSATLVIQNCVETFHQIDLDTVALTRAIEENDKESEELMAQFYSFATEMQHRTERAETLLSEETSQLTRKNDILLFALSKQTNMRETAEAELDRALALIPATRTLASAATTTELQTYESVGIMAEPSAKIRASIDVSTDSVVASYREIGVETEAEPGDNISTMGNAPSDPYSTTPHCTSYLDVPILPDSLMQRRLTINGFKETIMKLEKACDIFLNRQDARAARKASRAPIHSSA